MQCSEWAHRSLQLVLDPAGTESYWKACRVKPFALLANHCPRLVLPVTRSAKSHATRSLYPWGAHRLLCLSANLQRTARLLAVQDFWRRMFIGTETFQRVLIAENPGISVYVLESVKKNAYPLFCVAAGLCWYFFGRMWFQCSVLSNGLCWSGLQQKVVHWSAGSARWAEHSSRLLATHRWKAIFPAVVIWAQRRKIAQGGCLISQWGNTASAPPEKWEVINSIFACLLKVCLFSLDQACFLLIFLCLQKNVQPSRTF